LIELMRLLRGDPGSAGKGRRRVVQILLEVAERINTIRVRQESDRRRVR
jgi:hypothetical protein